MKLIRIIVAAVLAMFAASAAAVVEYPCGEATGLPWQGVPAMNYQCAPGSITATLASTTRISTLGAVMWWSCKTADGAEHRSVAAVTSAYWFSTSIGTDLAKAAFASPDKQLPLIQDIWKRYATTSWLSPELKAVWCPYEAEIYSFLTAPAAVPDVFVVAKNGTYTTRPTYPVVNGVRGTTATGNRAVIGQACDCSKLRFAETNLYCAAPGFPAEVTLCTKVAQ